MRLGTAELGRTLKRNYCFPAASRWKLLRCYQYLCWNTRECWPFERRDLRQSDSSRVENQEYIWIEQNREQCECEVRVVSERRTDDRAAALTTWNVEIIYSCSLIVRTTERKRSSCRENEHKIRRERQWQRSVVWLPFSHHLYKMFSDNYYCQWTRRVTSKLKFRRNAESRQWR